MKSRKIKKWRSEIEKNPFPAELRSLEETFFAGFERPAPCTGGIRSLSLDLFRLGLSRSIEALSRPGSPDFALELNSAEAFLFYSKLLILNEKKLSAGKKLAFDRFFNELLVKAYAGTQRKRSAAGISRAVSVYRKYLFTPEAK